MKVISVVGKKKAGKTSLIVRLIPRLRGTVGCIGCIKHAEHLELPLNDAYTAHTGVTRLNTRLKIRTGEKLKDTERMLVAGADVVVGVTSDLMLCLRRLHRCTETENREAENTETEKSEEKEAEEASSSETKGELRHRIAEEMEMRREEKAIIEAEATITEIKDAEADLLSISLNVMRREHVDFVIVEGFKSSEIPKIAIGSCGNNVKNVVIQLLSNPEEITGEKIDEIIRLICTLADI